MQAYGLIYSAAQQGQPWVSIKQWVDQLSVYGDAGGEEEDSPSRGPVNRISDLPSAWAAHFLLFVKLSSADGVGFLSPRER